VAFLHMYMGQGAGDVRIKQANGERGENEVPAGCPKRSHGLGDSMTEVYDHSIIVGIAGGSGSGKTTLASAIYERLGAENVAFISHDSYYRDRRHLTLEERDGINFDHPEALETDLLVEHLKLLKMGNGVNIPTYDFAVHSRSAAASFVLPKPIIIVEGILIFSEPRLLELLDIKIFVDTDDDVRFIRRLQRDTTERGRSLENVVSQYETTVKPMHFKFVEPNKQEADIIVPKGYNRVALDMIVERLRVAL
jgi:uridine kinase